MVTIKEIAKRVGKTEATVSMALNNKPGVSDAVRKRIKETAAEMGYMPNIIARELSTQASSTVGLIVPDLENPFFSAFAGHVNTCLAGNGCRMMLSVSNQSKKNESSAVSDMISRRVDGIIIVPVTDDTDMPGYSAMLERSGLPFVFATSHYPAWETHRVMSDLTMGERLAYDYLLKIGHRRIMFLGTNPLSPSNSLRIKGAYEACMKLGFDPEEVISVFSIESPDFLRAYNFMRESLAKKRFDCTAITTINDIMALGAMKALIGFGISVPDDVSLMGFDNLIFSEIATVPLTTVEQDSAMIAERTVYSLLDGSWKDRGCIRIKPRLVLRSSACSVRKENIIRF